MLGQTNSLATGIASIRFAGLLLALLIFSSSVYAQTGRIAGEITVEGTDETLPGVNVIIDDIQAGAASNLDGYYSIVNVPPGTYTLRASAVGFATVVVEDVRVNIDQTTDVNISMREQEFVGDEVVVVATRPVVERDVSSSRANISSEQIESLPVSNIQSVVGLQAGIQGGSIRGLGSEFSQWSMSGISLRDERDNTPYQAVSLVSVSEVQVQTGGFNAEYGNVQSGIVNIVTKEGSRDRYNADVIFRYSPPGKKHFGPDINDPNSFFMRPYLDDAVAWTGTSNGEWDRYTQRHYPEFEGWIAVAENNMNPESPYYGLSPAAAQQVFLWQKRKDFAISEPDYDLDVGFGGPVPFIISQLGNLRFWASHRRSEEMYLFPLSRDRYEDHSTHIKVTSDLIQGAGMKLSIETLFGSQMGTNSNNSGNPGMFRGATGIAGAPNMHSYQTGVVFGSDYFAPTQVDRFVLGAKFTHSISSDTFYEVQLSNFRSSYDTNPSPRRSDEVLRVFGNGYGATEAPFGFMPEPADGIGDGMRMGVGMSNSRDSSKVNYLTADFDITSQINRYLQLKSGLEFVRTHSQVNYARYDAFLPSQNTVSRWDKKPLRGGAYAQARLEFEGMVANIGLRMDYSYANTTWYEFDPFEAGLGTGNIDDIDELLDSRSTDHQVYLSPRIGVSFPITVESKLYFNYGHFRSMPTPENLYMVREENLNNRVSRIANPNLPLPQTVAYELGYEHNILQNYLVRVAGFYSDISNHSELVSYESSNRQVSYTISQPNRYRDHRGLEFTLERRGGRYFSGFVNYTYTVTSTGRFDFATQYENPAQQREYERTTTANDQLRPVARPYARASLDFFTPAGFGPELGSLKPFQNWRLNLLGSWQAGRYFTWAGGGGAPRGIVNNVQWRDYYNVNMRISREVVFADTRVQFFMDMNNVLNTRHMSQFGSYGYQNGEDYNRYLRSLHLDREILDELDYAAVPGSDRPGDYRKSSVEFVPIEPRSSLADVDSPSERALYFNTDTEEYFQFVNDEFVPADEDFVKQVLDDKAYIEMPNHTFFTFLNPRNVFWGIRIRF